MKLMDIAFLGASALLFAALAQGVAAQADVREEGPQGRLDEGLSSFEGTVPVFVRMEDQLFSVGGDYERF